ncbi:MAG: tRNA (adenine(22)-N(1))-methyltransferase TrmK, partial [Ruminococcus sp.]|nr:tRNA (adenine(22)-N(1))-methyltransferase TrmK [Ruminococcus sp.]
EKSRTFLELILQPMNYQAELRLWLLENDFTVISEDLSSEGFKVYNLLKVTPKKDTLKYTGIDVHLPKSLRNHPLFPMLYEKKKREFTKILTGLKMAENKDFDAISKYDEKDSTSKGYNGDTYSSLNNDIKGMKIGIAREYLDGVRDDVKEAVLNAAEVYKSLGAEIVYFDLPALKFALPVYYIIACAEASSNLGRYDGIRYGYKTEHYNGTHDMICRTRSEGFGEEVKRRILLGTYVLSAGYYDAYYNKAQNLRGTIVKAFNDAFTHCDVILAPTVPMTAFEMGRAVSDPSETYLTDICTGPVTIAGLPGVSVPCGFNAKGMPIGMQLIGKSFGEAEILNAAYKYQQAAGENFKDTKWGVKL